MEDDVSPGPRVTVRHATYSRVVTVEIRDSCEKTWPASTTSVGVARDFVADFLLARVPADVVEEARLIASELTSNAVLHAGTPFTVTVELTDADVTLRVRDGSSRVPVTPSANRLADQGRGLVLVDALSVAWGTAAETDGGKSVWARFMAVTSGPVSPAVV